MTARKNTAVYQKCILGETAAVNANYNPSVRHQVVRALKLFHIFILAVRHYHSLSLRPSNDSFTTF